MGFQKCKIDQKGRCWLLKKRDCLTIIDSTNTGVCFICGCQSQQFYEKATTDQKQKDMTALIEQQDTARVKLTDEGRDMKRCINGTLLTSSLLTDWSTPFLRHQKYIGVNGEYGSRGESMREAASVSVDTWSDNWLSPLADGSLSGRRKVGKEADSSSTNGLNYPGELDELPSPHLLYRTIETVVHQCLNILKTASLMNLQQQPFDTLFNMSKKVYISNVIIRWLRKKEISASWIHSLDRIHMHVWREDPNHRSYAYTYRTAVRLEAPIKLLVAHSMRNSVLRCS